MNSIVVQHLKVYILLSLAISNQAATIIQNPKLANINDGFLELKPNGVLILRSTLNNSSNIWQEALIFKVILNVIRAMMPQTNYTLNDLNQKMYGDGDEHKFPPFLERVIQRIQTYFSIYKYTDTSQPIRDDFKSSSTSTPATTAQTTDGIANVTLTLDQQNEIDVNLSSKPLETSTSITPKKSTVTYNAEADEINEFIELKDHKLLEDEKL